MLRSRRFSVRSPAGTKMVCKAGAEDRGGVEVRRCR